MHQKKVVMSFDFDKIPIASLAGIDARTQIPYDDQIEKSVLGLLLVERSEYTASAMLVLSQGVFYDPAHRLIFAAIEAIDSSTGQVDLYTVGQQLKQSGNLAVVGGMAYLSSLTMCASSGSHIDRYVKILVELSIKRKVATASYNALRGALCDGDDIEAVVNGLVSSVELTQLMGIEKSQCQPIATLTEHSIERAHERQRQVASGGVVGISSGLRSLDSLTGGWRAGELIVLAARPSMGKTALMLQFARSAAAAGHAVVVFSLEMSSVSLVDRLLCSVSTVSADTLRTGRLDEADFRELSSASHIVSQLPISIDDRAGVGVQYIATHSRMLRRRGKCSAIFIDYLQLLDMRAERGRSREQDVAQASAALKRLAKELEVPVVILSQLSRQSERRDNREPMLSDLRDSGAIEQDADIVMFVHRPEYYDRQSVAVEQMRLSNGALAYNVPIKGLGKLIVAKHREGATADIKFSYNEALTRVWDFDESPYLSQF